jgi:ubiquinone/menaquinone biosynthesis C-methylase UbiE
VFDLRPGDRILDLHAGDGQASRELALQVPMGVLVGLASGLDLLHQARSNTRDLDNTFFVEAEPREIPWKEDYFSHAIARRPIDGPSLREVYRVLAESGRIFLPEGEESDLREAGFVDIKTADGWLSGRKERPTTAAG